MPKGSSVARTFTRRAIAIHLTHDMPQEDLDAGGHNGVNQSEVVSYIHSGGIAFVCAEPWNWTDYSGVNAATNSQVAQWATFYASLKPAQLLFSPRHEPDGHVNNVSNTPEAYRAMWANMRSLFDKNGATNVLLLMDYSGKIGHGAAGTASLIKPLWRPGGTI
jgi:hypothetical protein